ncbi:MAG: AraC family transcriptional regulator ligand-binding domain-containing protein [Hyphomicrobiaceae bacterium]
MKPRSDIVTLAEQFRIMASIGRDLRTFCEPLGIDLDAIAAPLQVDTGSFENFETYMSFDKLCRLLEALASLSEDDAFGLKYGQFVKGGVTGPFGFALSRAPNFKDMLYFYVKYVHIIGDLDVFNATIEKDHVTIEWTYSPLLTQREQFVDFSAAAVMRVFGFHAGAPVQLLHAQLERRPPRDKSLYTKIFSKNIQFEADINKVVLPAGDLDGVNPSADEVMFDYMAKKCEAIAHRMKRKKDIITTLKEDFIQHMESNDRAIADVARRHGMSERTLQRRLAENGVGFWEIYENTRDELSMCLLTESDLPLSDVSRRLGYSSQSAYTRAVKRWHGKSPGELRKQR